MVSKTKLDLVEENFGQIKDKLQDYLLEKGLDTRNGKKIKCINPEHNDKSPSMSVFKHDSGYPLARCNSCGFIADIFTACHVLEEKPVTGPAFLHENVKYLADKYNIEVSVGVLTEEELYELSTYDAYKAASNFINAFSYSPKCLTEIENRHWNEDFAREYLVSCCIDYHAMRSHLKGLGFGAKFLDEIDLDNQKIFNQDNLIFTICDEYGRPVGFSGRNLNYDEVDKEKIQAPKFTNTKTTGLRCNIFKKSERLYLMHIAKKYLTGSEPLYIFEGYGDALTAHSEGLKNSVSCNTSTVNDKQLNLCRKLGINDIIICLDGDKIGIEKGNKILDEVLKTVHDLRIRFIFMPWDGNNKTDPDKFIREHGIKTFASLPIVEPFSWRLQQFIEDLETKHGKVTDSDAQFICQTMIPIIASEPSPLKRETMIRELVNYTGFTFVVIKEEVEKILNAEVAAVSKKKKSIIDQLINSLQTKTDGFEISLERAFQDLEDVNKESNTDVLGTESLVSFLDGIKSYQENEDMHRTINFGRNFETLPIAFAGDTRQKVILLGGTPNSGKSSKFSNLALNLAESNEDIVSLVLSIDDSAKEFISRTVCYDIARRLFYGGDHDLFDCLDISKIATPFRYKHLPEYEVLMQERNYSYKYLRELTASARFGIFDATFGKSISLMRNIIKKTKQRFPHHRIFFFVDNFHLMEGMSEAEGREKYSELSHGLKDLAVLNDMTIISTAEYTKLPQGQKPSNNNLAESRSLEYDANAIIHLYNELHDLRDKARLYYTDSNGQKFPVVESYFGKNKIAGFKGNIWYKFYADKSFYEEINTDQVDEIKLMNSTDGLFDLPKQKEEISIMRREQNG